MVSNVAYPVEIFYCKCRKIEDPLELTKLWILGAFVSQEGNRATVKQNV